MDQAASDQAAGLDQDPDVAHSVAIEADLKKTKNSIQKQDGTDVQDKQVLIIPLSTEDANSRIIELCLQSDMTSSNTNIQQTTASSIPFSVISSPSSLVNSSGPSPSIIRPSPLASKVSQSQQNVNIMNIGSRSEIELLQPGSSELLTATHAGLPKIISTISPQTFLSQALRISNPGHSPLLVTQAHGLVGKSQDDDSSQGPSPKAFKQDITLSPVGGDARPRLRLAPISALSNKPSPTKVPPPSMPPLLRLPPAPPVYSIPVSSSGPSKSMIHETPIQAAYANIPIGAPNSQAPLNSPSIVELLGNSKQYIPQSQSVRASTEASYSISLPDGRTASYSIELPGGSKATASFPVTLPGGSAEEAFVLSDNSSTSGGDLSNKDANNASKCREYRERSKARKEQEMKDFQHHLDKNIHLKAIYDKKTETIRKLKQYYLKCLQNRRYKCVENKPDSSIACVTSSVTGLDSPEFSSDSSASAVSSKPLTSVVGTSGNGICSGNVTNPQVKIKTEDSKTECSSNGSEVSLPMVTIKAEDAELLIANVKSEV